MKMIFLLLVFVSGVLSSCAKTESSNIKTSGFYASYTLTGNNQNSVNCQVTFQVGGITGTYIDLDAADTVTCDGNSMTRSELAGSVSYSATLPYTPGATYTVVLARAGEGSYSSTVVLPAAITGFSPAVLTAYQKASPVTVSWAPSSHALDGMNIYLNYTGGSQSYSYMLSDTAPENGTLGYSSAQTQVNPPVSGTFTGTVRFSRFRYGTMSAGLDGTITAKQEVGVGVQLTD